MRTWYALRSGFRLRADSLDPRGNREYWQAGKSVAAIESVVPAGDIVRACAAAAATR
jgi:nitronate monooxygenase